MQNNPQSDRLMAFSRQVGEVLQETVAFYPPLFAEAVALTREAPSPSAEAHLMEIRTTAANMADTMAVLSRNTSILSEEYNQLQIGISFNPQTVRGLMLELMENCFLLSRVPSLGELGDLSIMTPQELEAKIMHPQIEDWLRSNTPPGFDPMAEILLDEGPVPAPNPDSYQPPSNPTVPQTESSPYPQVEPSPYPQVEPSPYPQVEPSPYPAAGPEPSAYPEIPSSPSPAAPAADPWNQPPARPSTEGDRSRNRPL